MSEEVNKLLDKLGKLEDAPLIWINKKVYDASKEIERLKNQLQQKENIIKEVREWANKTIFYFDFEEEITKHSFDLLYTKQGQELLKILDMEDKQ